MSKLFDLLADIPTNAVLRERIELIREQAAKTEKQLAEALKENETLRTRVAALEKQVPAKTAGEFVEHRGVYFKRKPGGGFHHAVYCFACKNPMSSPEGEIPYHCPRCNQMVEFNERQLSGILREVAAL
jgi:hypothetical protein